MRVFNGFFVYLLLVFSMFTACRSTKSVSDFHEQSQIHIRGADSACVELQMKDEQLELMNELMSEGWDIDFTIFMPPDSAGVQPVKAKAKMRKTKNVLHQEQRIRNKDETSKAKNNSQRYKAAYRETQEKAENFKFSELINLKTVAYVLLTIFALIWIYKFRKWLR